MFLQILDCLVFACFCFLIKMAFSISIYIGISLPIWFSNKNPFRIDQNKQQFLRKNIGTRRFRIRENMAWARYLTFSQFSTLLQTVFQFRIAKRGVFCRHPIFVSRNLLWRNMWSTFTLSNFLPLQAWYVRMYVLCSNPLSQFWL